MAIPTLGVEEFQYMDNGVLLNGGVSVPFVDLNKIDGLDGADLRISTHDREGTDGGYVDAEFEGLRTVILDGTVYTNNQAFETFLDQLKANFAPRKLAAPLYFGTDAGIRCVFGKPTVFRYSKDALRRLGSTNIQIQVACEDPRIYSPNVLEQQALLGSAALTGRGYNKGYAYGYGGIGNTNSVSVNLLGNRSAPGIIRIYGPIVNPVLVNDTLGITMSIAATIANGDYYEINLNTKTVKLNGTAGRRNLVTLSGPWYLLQPGNNTFRVTGSGTTAGISKLYIRSQEAAWR